ncbi:MAG: glutathione peroxidase [Flaviaesturariibacter sp.]|nr:glutathione peroxidase [Flaviaesturariibacter sp.]
MTIRQRLLRAFYPVLMAVTKLAGKNRTILQNANGALPPQPLEELAFTTVTGAEQPLGAYRNRKILIVNTASDCGYTAQYTELQQLSEQYGDRVVVIAFPSNDFSQQEKGSNEDIARFCLGHYNVRFPLAAKSGVIRNRDQHPVYQWLTEPSRNGWNSQPPTWNFSKYIVNEDGILTHYFGPSVSPLDEQIVRALDA